MHELSDRNHFVQRLLFIELLSFALIMDDSKFDWNRCKIEAFANYSHLFFFEF